MRAGSLDGKGVIYDHDGRLALRPDESRVRVVTDAYAQVMPGWGRLAGKGSVIIDSYGGKGSWFITDKRMVFIRKPDSKGARRWLMGPTTFPDGVNEVLRCRQVVREGGYDYCEVLYEDVRFYKRRRTGGKLLLMVSATKYAMPVKLEMLEAVLPFLKKRGIEQR